MAEYGKTVKHYKNPHLIGSKEYNQFEREWSQEVKRGNYERPYSNRNSDLSEIELLKIIQNERDKKKPN